MTSKPEGIITSTTASISTTPVIHQPVIIKDEWTSGVNGESNIDIIEGRKALPAVPTVR